MHVPNTINYSIIDILKATDHVSLVFRWRLEEIQVLAKGCSFGRISTAIMLVFEGEKFT